MQAHWLSCLGPKNKQACEKGQRRNSQGNVNYIKKPVTTAAFSGQYTAPRNSCSQHRGHLHWGYNKK